MECWRCSAVMISFPAWLKAQGAPGNAYFGGGSLAFSFQPGVDESEFTRRLDQAERIFCMPLRIRHTETRSGKSPVGRGVWLRWKGCRGERGNVVVQGEGDFHGIERIARGGAFLKGEHADAGDFSRHGSAVFDLRSRSDAHHIMKIHPQRAARFSQHGAAQGQSQGQEKHHAASDNRQGNRPVTEISVLHIAHQRTEPPESVVYSVSGTAARRNWRRRPPCRIPKCGILTPCRVMLFSGKSSGRGGVELRYLQVHSTGRGCFAMPCRTWPSPEGSVLLSDAVKPCYVTQK